MKRFFSSWLSRWRSDAGAEPEPTDPAERHDYLYRQATERLQPYLLLHGGAARSGRTSQGRAELEETIGLFARVLALNPDNWAAAWLAGKAAQSQGDHERAYQFFKRSFGLQQDNADVARELTIAALETTRPDEAVEVAEHAVGLAPADAGLQANLALARLCAGNLAGAEASIAAAIAGDPRDDISRTIERVIGEVKRGERKPPRTPAELES